MSRFFGYIQRNPAVVSGPCFVIVMANVATGVHDPVAVVFVSVWFLASLAYHARRRLRGGPWLS